MIRIRNKRILGVIGAVILYSVVSKDPEGG